MYSFVLSFFFFDAANIQSFFFSQKIIRSFSDIFLSNSKINPHLHRQIVIKKGLSLVCFSRKANKCRFLSGNFRFRKTNGPIRFLPLFRQTSFSAGNPVAATIQNRQPASRSKGNRLSAYGKRPAQFFFNRYESICLITSSRGIAPCTSMGLPCSGTNKIVGMLWISNVRASSVSLSTLIL